MTAPRRSPRPTPPANSDIHDPTPPVAFTKHMLSELFRSGDLDLRDFMTLYHDLLRDRAGARGDERREIDSQLVAIKESRDDLKRLDASEAALGLILRINASANLFLVPLDAISEAARDRSNPDD